MYIGFVVATVVRIKIAEKIVSQKVFRVIVYFGYEFLANFRSVRPFIFPEQGQAKEVVCVRRAGIKDYGLLEFADGIILHFSIAIRVAEEHMQRAGVAHGGDDVVKNLGGFLLAFRIF